MQPPTVQSSVVPESSDTCLPAAVTDTDACIDTVTIDAPTAATSESADHTATWHDDVLDITLDADSADDDVSLNARAPRATVDDAPDDVDSAADIPEETLGSLVDIELILDETPSDDLQDVAVSEPVHESDETSQVKFVLPETTEPVTVSEALPETVQSLVPTKNTALTLASERTHQLAAKSNVADTQELINRYGSLPDISQTRPQSIFGRLWHGIKSAIRRLFHRRRS